jgi:hypothetical protein
MTNHPGRRRGDDEEPQGAEELAAAVPAVQEMADELAAQVPPGHTPNGVPPGLKPDRALLAAQAVAQALGEHLPNMLFQAMSAALSQAPAPPQRMCATCIVQRIAWENAHRTAMDAAIAAACEATGVEPGSPDATRLDLAAFLPPALHPGQRGGMPGVAQALTTFQGTEMCPMHVAQAGGVQPGSGPLIVACGSIPDGTLAQVFGQIRGRAA